MVKKSMGAKKGRSMYRQNSNRQMGKAHFLSHFYKEGKVRLATLVDMKIAVFTSQLSNVPFPLVCLIQFKSIFYKSTRY